MPKITRATQKIFGDTAGAVNNFGVFGSLAANGELYVVGFIYNQIVQL